MFWKSFLRAAILAFLMLLPFGAGLASADSHCEFADETIKFGGIAPLSPPGSTGVSRPPPMKLRFWKRLA